MNWIIILCFGLFISVSSLFAQTSQDSMLIRQAALDYIESQHNVDGDQFARSAHPRMVKRTFWTHKPTGKEYLRETFTDAMILLADSYNKEGERFPKTPKKEVVILDIFGQTASVKLIADDWIDYMHIVKLNGEWKIVNVLWQMNNAEDH